MKMPELWDTLICWVLHLCKEHSKSIETLLWFLEALAVATLVWAMIRLLTGGL